MMRWQKRSVQRVGVALLMSIIASTVCAQKPKVQMPKALVAKLLSWREMAALPDQQKLAAALWLTPRPALMAFIDASNSVSPATPVVVTSKDPGAVFAARHFVDSLERSGAFKLNVIVAKKPPSHAIVFEFDPHTAVDNSEGYVLDTETGDIVV
ncbi:MAG TPA: hypothetical protein VFI32_01880, partial [Rhodanobacteraceae bacterium]|nr:hypothetical protein [Rhodanobacteraceae bacterium]